MGFNNEDQLLKQTVGDAQIFLNNQEKNRNFLRRSKQSLKHVL